jgi:hypothetical protein
MSRYCPAPESVELFNQSYKKNREDLTPEEFRAIVACYGWLSDDERAKFNIKLSDLTDDEKNNYQKLHLLDIYFGE